MYRNSSILVSRNAARRLSSPLRAFLPRESIREFRPGALCSKADFPDLDSSQIEKIAQNPLIAKLSNSQGAMVAIQDMLKVLEQKGYGEQMGVFKQIKLLMDKDVKAQMVKLKETLENEGIQLRKEDIESLIELIGIKNK